MNKLPEQPGDSPAIQAESSERTWRGIYRRRRGLVLFASLMLTAAVSLGYRFWSVEAGLHRARRAVDRLDWAGARVHLANYLQRHPEDPEAHLLMAEAYVKDNSGHPRRSVELAVHHLQQVGDDSSLAGRARLQEARLTFLILLQPMKAERLLRQSLRLDPGSFEANLLMWKVLDLTGRHIASRDYFWRAYDLSPESERGDRLRDWFLAEFYPETANAQFHAVFGTKKIHKIPASVNLLVRFRENEPEAPFVHAALAAYYLGAGKRKSSLELLKEAPDLEQAMRDPFFASVLFETLVDFGESQKTRVCFANWPRPHAGYLYWRAEGMFRQDVLHDPSAAAISYQKALSTWPGKFDWQLMMRLSGCLRAIGRVDDAERLRTKVEHLTKDILTRQTTSQLRSRLANLRSPLVARDVRNFYREFGLTREANAWEDHRIHLTRASQSFESNRL